jgi:hypothetical protein
MYSEYNRTSGADTGTTAVAVTLARAPLALPARGTICSSCLRLTKSQRKVDSSILSLTTTRSSSLKERAGVKGYLACGFACVHRLQGVLN